MWQRGVQARLRLLQGRWREAEQVALAVLATGDIPMGRLWSHLVLGLLAARRDAPAENPHLDELWRLATKLDVAGVLAPVVAALAEQAWITGRPDPRLDGSLGGGTGRPAQHGRARDAPVGATAGRRRRPGPRSSGAAVTRSASRAACPTRRRWTLWDGGSTDELLAALPLLDDLGARAVAALVRRRLRGSG